MIDWSLAIRNLLRNRRRSLSTLLALAIGLAAILLFSGFKANLTYTGLTLYAQAGGHLQVQHRDYFLYGSGNPAAYGMSGYAALVEKIRDDPVLKPMLSVVTPTLRFGGLAGNFDAGISRTVLGTGSIAEDVNRMRQWNEFAIPLSRPRFPLEGTPADSAIVGFGVARVLQLCAKLKVGDCPTPDAVQATTHDKPVALPKDIAALSQLEGGSPASGAQGGGGARMELLSSSSRGAPNVASLNVVVAENQGFKELDEVSLIVHLTQAQRLVFGRGQPRITSIVLLLNKSADEPVAAARLREIVATHSSAQPLVVRRFDELNPFYVQSEQLFDVIFGFIFVLIGGIVLFTVGNTMNTAVVERTVEIGTLRAIGSRRGLIRRLFVVEGLVLGFAGALLGLIAALVLAAAINFSGITWLPPGSSERMALQVRVLSDMFTVVGTTLSLVLIATASAWWPAWRAANLNMVEALRHA